jgi:hypothetical protein
VLCFAKKKIVKLRLQVMITEIFFSFVNDFGADKNMENNFCNYEIMLR